MNRFGKYLLIALCIAVLFVAFGIIYIARPINDGRTPAERRKIAEACFAMLHSSLTDEVEDIKMDDPRIPEAIRALHPHHIEVIPNSAVDIYREDWPQEYFLVHIPQSTNTNTWILYVDGPSIRFGGGGREIFRMTHD